MAERKKILLRADGNSGAGLGHMYRVLALADAFAPDYECLIVTRPDSHAQMFDNRYPVVRIPVTEYDAEPGWLSERYPASEWTMVADGYHFTSAYQQKIKEKGYYLIYIDDLITGHYFADVVVNHSLAARFSDYEAEPYTRFALGPKYALLRKTFSNAPAHKRTGSTRTKAFVCFGGADPSQLSLKAAAALVRIEGMMSVHLVVGTAFSEAHRDALTGLSQKVKVHTNLDADQVAALMSLCDFAVSSASNVLYELCAMQVPVVAGYYVNNQEGLYKGFEDSGSIRGAGDISGYQEHDFYQLLTSFLEEKNWEHYQGAQRRLFDGRSHERLRKLLHRVTYRKAQEKDMLLVFDWSNDPDTRANSYATEPIQLDGHKSWYARKISDPGSVMLIAEVDGKAAGLIRYDLNEGHAVVGVLVDASFRGHGWATIFLRDTARTFVRTKKMRIDAFIKKSNMASVKAFEKAGYKLGEEKVVQGSASYIYRIGEQDV